MWQIFAHNFLICCTYFQDPNKMYTILQYALLKCAQKQMSTRLAYNAPQLALLTGLLKWDVSSLHSII